MIRLLAAHPFLRAPVAGGEVGFAADDRFDARLLRGRVKLDRPGQIAVVGDGNRFLAQFHGPRHKPVNMAHAVEEAVVGVVMKVGEQALTRPEHAPEREARESNKNRQISEESCVWQTSSRTPRNRHFETRSDYNLRHRAAAESISGMPRYIVYLAPAITTSGRTPAGD